MFVKSFHFINKLVSCYEVRTALGGEILRKQFLWLESDAGILTVIDKDRGNEDIKKINIINGEFNSKKSLRLIILHIIDVGSKIIFHNSVNTLGLTVGLGIVRGGKLNVDSQAFTQELPELRDKLGSTVRNEVFGDAVEFLHILVKDVRCFFGFHNGRGYEISHFNKAIDKDEDISISNTHKNI
jgi:hypothetical protein